MKDIIAPVAQTAAAFFFPLRMALSSPVELIVFLQRFGFRLETDEIIDEIFDTEGLYGDFATLIAGISEAIDAAESLARDLADDPASVSYEDILSLVDTLRDVPAMVQGFRGPSRPSMPVFLDIDEVWETLAEDLPEQLLADYLAAMQPKLYAVLRNLGIVQRIRVVPDEMLLRGPYLRDDFRWDYLADLIEDPLLHLKEIYGWGGLEKPGGGLGWLDYRALLSALQSLFTSGSIPAKIEPMDQAPYEVYFPAAEFGDDEAATRPRQLTIPLLSKLEPNVGRVELALLVAPIPEPGDYHPAGLVFSHRSYGNAGGEIDLGDGWAVNAAGQLDADHLLRLNIRASGVELETETPGIPTLSLDLTGTPQTESGRWGLIGDVDGTGISVGGFTVRAAFGDDGSGPDLTLGVDVTDLAIAIRAGEGDSFINAVLDAVDIAASVSLSAVYSTRDGLTLVATGGSLGGPDGFNFDLPVSINLGPFTLDGVNLKITSLDGGLALRAITDISAAIGPFAAEVLGLGMGIDLIQAEDGQGQIGPFDIAARFEPPTRVAFALTTEAVTGGGFLEISETRYSGALMLEALSVSIAAITVIDTALPDDPDGWAFFAALSLTFPAIPLGFGFTLTGLGGLVALNREFDDIALASGLKSGAADALLFPEDPVNDAAAIISQIDTYFPPVAGNTVIGPMVQIGWGVPKTLITAELGVVISLPQGLIALLGTVAAQLPDPQAPLLSLRMDILGSVNVPDGTMMMLASLYDSNLLETIELSGDMGTFLATKDQPYFLLSVGGYNPGFRPPALVPAPLQDLRRMQARIELGGVVEVRITTYFAVTSNTVQFGSEVYMEAESKIGPVTFLAKGELGFHIFLQFSPFLIKADFEASVGIYVGGSEVFSAYLTAHLEGPDPWYALGTAGFKFLGKDIDFEVEVGSNAPPEDKPLVPLRDHVVVALADSANWREVALLADMPAAISYLEVDEEEDDRFWVRPDHAVEVSQGAAPLNREIEKAGQGLPTPGHERIEFAAVRLGGEEADALPLQDWFAPAQFETIGKQEKLSRASFEKMDAGVTLSSPDVKVTAHAAELGREAEIGYEEVLFEPEAGPEIIVLPSNSLALSVRSSGAGHALRRQRRTGGAGEFQLADSAFTVVDAMTGEVAEDVLVAAGLNTAGTSQHAAMQAMSSNSGANLRVVPASVEVAA